MLPYYFSKQWKKKRIKIIKRDKVCQVCKSTQQLCVHHLTYKRYGGKERLGDLILLCADCHNNIHKQKKWSALNPVGKAKKKRTGLVRNANEAKILIWRKKWLGY